jgi:hypothetical protein
MTLVNTAMLEELGNPKKIASKMILICLVFNLAGKR